MRSRTWMTVALCAVLFGAARPAAAQTERNVYVTVLDTSGMPVFGLGADFFAIREDGRDREVVRAVPAQGPMHVALLVDTSSAIGVAAEPYRAAINAFVTLVAPGNRMAIYEFGANALQVIPFTDDVMRLKEGVGRIVARADSLPRLVDAIDMACADLKAQRPERPVVVVVSVAATDTSARTAGNVIKQLIDLPAALHLVAVSGVSGGPTSPSLTTASGRDEMARRQRILQLEAAGEGDRERTRLMTEGTTKSGGAIHRVASVLAIQNGLDKVSAELAACYRVTFSRPSPGKMKDLQVGVMLDGVTVRATAAPAPR
jgi:VWFA-related protein